MRQHTLLIILSLLFLNSLSAQTDSLPKVRVIGRAHPNKVMLRWAPTTPYAWQVCNKFGYTIERVTMTKNQKIVKKRALTKLNAVPIKLWPEEKWATIINDSTGNTDKYVAISAQAIFGSSFTLTENYSSDFTKVIEKSQENEKRFTFALFSADQSLKVAEAMGLYYVDSNVQPDEQYLYRVYSNVPKETLAIDTGYVFIGPPDHAELPRPIELHGDFANESVTLTWNREMFEDIYSNYEIQRSTNGEDFYRLDDLPFINTAPEHNRNPRLMYRMDSLPEQDINYHYRVRGRTPFNELGPWSDTISGQSIIALTYRPLINKAAIIDNKIVKLEWEFPIEHNTDIEYFTLYRAEKASGNYKEIAPNLNPEERTFTDSIPTISNYYILKAFDKHKQSGSSFPYFVQLVDSFPPGKPATPMAIIDSTGVVTISWEKGPEEDITGYRVFRSNFKSEEFGQVTSSPVDDTIYSEKINIKSLSRKIYYKIAAIDYNFNQSELSDMVLLIKPDIVPPTPPLFKKPKMTSEGIGLEWINSSSKDVTKHIIYRRKAGEKAWKTVAVIQIKDSVNQFDDKHITPKTLFEYTMLAVDSANNESKPCKSVFARKIDNGIRPSIEELKAEADKTNKQIKLSWQYPYEDVTSFIVYRAKNEENISYYKMITGDKLEFIDKRIELNTIYKYRIKARFKDDSESPFSNELVVEY